MGLIKPRLNTSDATATAADIFPGKTAYAAGEKLVGVATADATATAANILADMTAYAKGEKLVGTMVPESLASLTADATATAADIMSGKTAYSQGNKVTGNMPLIGNTPATVYSTDGNGNFGMLIPSEGRYAQNAIIYANAAAAGLTPEKIMQGQSILGVAGTAKGMPTSLLQSGYNTAAIYDLTSRDEQRIFNPFSGTATLAYITKGLYNGKPMHIWLKAGESGGALATETLPIFKLKDDGIYVVHDPGFGYREKGTYSGLTFVIFGDV